ncbi:hypothetical protein Phi10:1_gp058 [Cellulophaga phage phi10:1]|uniref:Uncharacterized protein n=1 Tax=Cellulophaga phage phi10:1 TaxID=1327981 RepID=R9ZYI0_9CAUD|nr:hypothetical protein Phi10:1_gp058 [Cellulophaga phage phi10:1]AGO48399.1 hypothetical protein Phi10:1_gp058 [Cellulophaga phage phi10:1]
MKKITLALLLLTSFICIGQARVDIEGKSYKLNPGDSYTINDREGVFVYLPYNENDHIYDWNNNGVYYSFKDNNEIEKLRIRIEELEAILRRIEAKLDKNKLTKK